MRFTPSQKNIKDTVKMFRSLKESGEVFNYSFNDETHEHAAILIYRHCADHCGDISILTLRLTDPEENKEYNFLPTEAKDVIETLVKWYEEEKILV